LIDELLKRVFAVYPRIEAQLAVPLFRQRTVLRLLQSGEEQNAGDANLACWNTVNTCPIFRQAIPAVPKQFGVFEVIQAAQLDIRRLILRVREFLLAQQSVVMSCSVTGSKYFRERIRWKRFTARYAIFCEGYRMAHNLTLVSSN